MRVANTSDMDGLPPPPYTEVAEASPLPNQPVQASLRGGYMRPSLPPEMLPNENNLSSSTTYFENRNVPDFPRAGAHLSLIEHHINFDGETTRADLTFPLPIEAYVARDVTSLDWSTFVNFLFPTRDEIHNGKDTPGKVSQRLSFVTEDTPARRDRILAIVAEWNENFFSPRRIHIIADFSPLPSYRSSRSTALPLAEQEPCLASRPLPPAWPTMNDTAPAQRPGNLSAPRPIHRASSTSSSSSSGSSSSSSVGSIKSKDLEGTDLSRVRSALLSFQLDASKGHLRASMRQFRNEIRSQRRDVLGKGKESKKEYKNQMKEIKKEIKAVVKQVKVTRRADRKIAKAERKSRKAGKRAEHRGNQSFQDKGQRAEDRATERVRRAQEKRQEVEERVTEKVARAHERAREVEAGAARAAARAQERGADAMARGWNQGMMARSGAAERRAGESAGRARYGVDGEQENGVLLREG